jgi:peptide deformylase
VSILKVARIGHPVVRARAADVPPARVKSAEIQRLIDDMVETMHEYDGVGLAAPQVHVGLRLAVIEVAGEDERTREAVPLTVLVNPVWRPLHSREERLDVARSGGGVARRAQEGGAPLEESIDGWEGCLSVPDLRGVVPRFRRLELRALDRKGKPWRVEAEDFFARVIQHECDHLDGGVYLDRMKGMRSLSFIDEWDRHVAHD